MKDHSERIKVYQTIIILSLAGLGAFWYWEKKELLLLAIGLLLVSLLVYPIARYIYLGWMALADVLGWVNTRILLGVVFFFLLTPLALVRRLFKAPLIEKKFDAEKKTYFHKRKAQVSSEDFEQLW